MHAQIRVDVLLAARQKAQDKAQWDKINGALLENAMYTLWGEERVLKRLLRNEEYFHWAQ